MKILSVELNNFRSFKGHHRLELDNKGLVFVKGENKDDPSCNSNGSGKSSLFDAIDWCLFGKAPNGGASNSVVNEDEGKECTVTVALEDDNGDLGIVYRGRKAAKNGLVFGIQGQDLSALDTKETQKKLEEFLGLNREVFHAAVYKSQDSEFNFASASDGDKKALLTAMLPELKELDTMKVQAKEKVKAMREELAEVSGLLKGYLENKATLKTLNPEEGRRSWQELNKKQQDELQVDIAHHEEQLKGLMDVAKLLDAKKQELADLKPPKEETAWASELDKRKEALDNLRKYDLDLSSRALPVQEKLKAWETKGDTTCMSCEQDIPAHHAEAQIAKLVDILKDIDEARQALPLKDTEGLVREAQDKARAEATANREASDGYAIRRSKLVADVSSLQEKLLSKDMLENRLQALLKRQSDLKGAVWPGESQVEEYNKKLAALEDDIKTNTALVQKLTEDIKYMDFWGKALSDRALKSYVLDRYIGDMNESCNRWIAKLTEGTVSVQFSTQTVGSTGKVSERLSVLVKKTEKDGTITERDFKSFSGGQRQRIALGIDMGLSELVANRAQKSWDIYIMDESFRQNLDDAGREAVFDLLEILSREKSSIFVVDHTGADSYFDNVIKVELCDKVSRIVSDSALCQKESRPAA